MTLTYFAKKLYTEALRCGIVNEEKRVKLSFVESSENAIHDDDRVYWNRNPSELLPNLTGYADNVAKITESRSHASSLTI